MARKALLRGDWASVEEYVRSRPNANERAYALEALGDWPGRHATLVKWKKERPGPISQAATAVNEMKWAWEARGGGYASSVKDQEWQSFGERLKAARASLESAWASDSKDASLAPWLIWCSRGLGDREMGNRVFAEAVRRAPELRAVYSSMMLSHASKWGGSDEQSLAFAREVIAESPLAGGAAVCLVEAHEYVYEQIAPFTDQKKAYWLAPQVRSDVVSADDVCARGGLTGMNGVRVRHWLAYGLWRVGEHGRAKVHFLELGKVPNDRPWGGFRRGFNWLLSPYPKARRVCLRA